MLFFEVSEKPLALDLPEEEYCDSEKAEADMLDTLIWSASNFRLLRPPSIWDS
jgi:hypothetical protein